MFDTEHERNFASLSDWPLKSQQSQRCSEGAMHLAAAGQWWGSWRTAETPNGIAVNLQDQSGLPRSQMTWTTELLVCSSVRVASKGCFEFSSARRTRTVEKSTQAQINNKLLHQVNLLESDKPNLSSTTNMIHAHCCKLKYRHQVWGSQKGRDLNQWQKRVKHYLCMWNISGLFFKDHFLNKKTIDTNDQMKHTVASLSSRFRCFTAASGDRHHSKKHSFSSTTAMEAIIKEIATLSIIRSSWVSYK